ncbi:MAG: hypothetical protein IJ335_05640 [Lachnospiraceae bacterium]|nr:hypothetical protein [Lachnospiraceae bacterium]
MEKKHFVTLVMGVVGGLIFALGMCMCLLPEWGMFRAGIGFGIVGAILLLATWIVYRKLAGKAPIKWNVKVIGKILYGIFATLVFGAGMCLTLAVEGMLLVGIVVGVVGIVLLLFMIPMCLGWKESKQQ